MDDGRRRAREYHDLFSSAPPMDEGLLEGGVARGGARAPWEGDTVNDRSTASEKSDTQVHHILPVQFEVEFVDW